MIGWRRTKDAPRTQRHTARRVRQRLVDEHGAEVGESTVRRYVGEARRGQPAVLREVTVPQSHPLGAEAEVDFGNVSFYLNGLLTEGWMFVMRLSASAADVRVGGAVTGIQPELWVEGASLPRIHRLTLADCRCGVEATVDGLG
jgi:hypothetical protein